MSKNSIKLVKYGLSRLAGLIVVLILPAIAGAQKPTASADSSPAQADQTKTQSEKPESKNLVDNFHFNFQLGGQISSISGDRPTKVEEYTRFREGFVLSRFRIASNPANSPTFFRAIGRNAGDIDQQYFVDFGSYGKFRTTFQYDGSPHLFSEGAKTLTTGGKGVLTIADSIQTTLETTPDAALPAAVQSIYASTSASTIRLRTQRHTYSFDQTVQLTDNWSLNFNWVRNQRSGSQPLGIGSYERIGTAQGDTFKVLSAEIPQQLDYTSDQVTFGTRYVKEHWGLSLDYIYSSFKNDLPSLTFDNPFRITDKQATSGGSFDRQQYAHGIWAAPPGNDAQTITASAFVDLPYDTRAAGAIGWSFWRQDEQFLPYTLNSAIVTGVPVGLNITSATSLPEQNLDGQVDIFTQDYLITSRPWKAWTFNAHFQRYDNNVNTQSIHFPGYAAYSESYWRSNIATIPIESHPKSFARSNFTAEAIWDITKAYSWEFAYEWEGWDRENRQVEKLSENSFTTQFKFKPVAQFNGWISYKYSDRKPDFYNSGILEYSGLRMFDQSARKRNDLKLQWQWAIKPNVGLSGTFGYLDDAYDENFYGLVKYSQGYGTVDLLYMPKDNTTFYVNYSRENYENSLKTIAKNATPWDLNNRWNRDEKDVLDSFGIGLTTFAVKDRLMLDLNYTYSNAVTQTTTFNPGVPAANTVLSATAYPFPDVTSRLHEFNSDVSYQFGGHWGLGIRYSYRPYNLDDFALNNLSPYPINQLPPEQEGRRYLLLDSRYSSHQAHLVTVYLNIK